MRRLSIWTRSRALSEPVATFTASKTEEHAYPLCYLACHILLYWPEALMFLEGTDNPTYRKVYFKEMVCIQYCSTHT